MQARGPLMVEHRLIERMIGLIEGALGKIESAGKADPVFIDTAVDETNWIMNVHSKALQPAREYSWRSDRRFTDQENAKLLEKFHNVAGFRE